MKLNKDILIERNRIICSFPPPIQGSSLVGTDISDHRRLVEKVYDGMLREVCVIDDCCRRFKRTFEHKDYFLVPLDEL